MKAAGSDTTIDALLEEVEHTTELGRRTGREGAFSFGLGQPCPGAELELAMPVKGSDGR